MSLFGSLVWKGKTPSYEPLLMESLPRKTAESDSGDPLGSFAAKDHARLAAGRTARIEPEPTDAPEKQSSPMSFSALWFPRGLVIVKKRMNTKKLLIIHEDQLSRSGLKGSGRMRSLT
jgi:hypothetical protein